MSNIIHDIEIDSLIPLTQKGGEIRIGISPKRCQSKHMIMGMVKLNSNEELMNHVHDYGEESIYVIEGEAQITIGDKQAQMKPNHMYFVPQGQPHSILNTGKETLVLAFGTSPLAPSPKQGDREISVNSTMQHQPVLGMKILNEVAPEILNGFRQLTSAIDGFSPLDLKAKELILLGIFTASGATRGIDTHTRLGLQAGATIEEIYAAISYALPISGITSVTKAIEVAANAIDDHMKG